MKRVLLNSFLSLALFTVSAFFVLRFLLIQSIYLTSKPIREDGSWYNYLNVLFNSYFVGGNGLSLASFVEPINSYFNINNANVLIWSIVLLIGLQVLIHSTDQKLSLFKHSLIVTLSFGIVCGFGADFVAISTLAIIVWLAIAIILINQIGNKRFCGLIIFIILQLHMAFEMPQLALIMQLLSFGLTFLLQPPSFRSFCLYLYSITSIILIFNGWNAPTPQLADYPAMSRVIPDDNVPGNIMPLVGPATSIPIINRLPIKNLYSEITIYLVLLTFVLFIYIRNWKNNNQYEVGALLVLSLLLFFECLLPESISLSLPIAAISRVIPGLYFHPVTPIIIGALILYLAIYATKYCEKFSIFILGILLIPLVRVGLATQALINDSLLPYQELDKLVETQKIGHEQYLNLRDLLVSPSYPVIQDLGIFLLLQKDSLLTLDEFSPNSKGMFLSSSHNQNEKDLRRLTDNRSNTRWSAARGRQIGDEFIEIGFDQPISISGIKLDVGNFTSDFPRGLRVLGSSTCTIVNNAIIAKYEVLSEQENFLGGIHFTPNGFPYYGAQSDVRVFFKEALDVQCLRVEQISKDNNFDWSIAEIRLLSSK